jgi:hypothetical protein
MTTGHIIAIAIEACVFILGAITLFWKLNKSLEDKIESLDGKFDNYCEQYDKKLGRVYERLDQVRDGFKSEYEKKGEADLKHKSHVERFNIIEKNISDRLDLLNGKVDSVAAEIKQLSESFLQIVSQKQGG